MSTPGLAANDHSTPAPRLVSWLAVWSLALRELTRFFRQRSRLVGAVGQPVLFWLLFGAGLQGSFNPPAWAPRDLTYQQYFFPGIAVLIVLFTAIFSTISIIEDRREGFLQGVLVAPVSRLSIVLGKVLGGAAIAWLQAGLFVLLAPTQGLSFHFQGLAGVLLFLALLAVTLTSLGFLIAWRLDSTQGFHAIMSVFLLPMWLLSGAFFPGEETGWLAWVIRLNPLTYGVAGLRRLLYLPESLPASASLPPLAMCLAVTFAFCGICLGLSVWFSSARNSADTR